MRNKLKDKRDKERKREKKDVLAELQNFGVFNQRYIHINVSTFE